MDGQGGVGVCLSSFLISIFLLCSFLFVSLFFIGGREGVEVRWRRGQTLDLRFIFFG